MTRNQVDLITSELAAMLRERYEKKLKHVDENAQRNKQLSLLRSMTSVHMVMTTLRDLICDELARTGDLDDVRTV